MDNELSPILNPLSAASIASADSRNDNLLHSNIFNSEQLNNQLQALAAPIFILATKLKSMQKCENDRSFLFEKLRDEVSVFVNKAKDCGFRSGVVTSSGYALCSLLDEIIINSPWSENLNWQDNNLLNHFHKETYGGEKFFILLDEAYHDSESNKDLLELMYTCLALGFMGKYRWQADGFLAINKITSLLYNCLLKQRGELKKNLFIKSEIPALDETKKHGRNRKSILIVSISLITICAIVVGWVVYG